MVDSICVTGEDKAIVKSQLLLSIHEAAEGRRETVAQGQRIGL